MHNNYPLENVPTLEYPACPICRADSATNLLNACEDWVPDGTARTLRFSVVRCAVCGTCYTTPRFTESSKHLAFEGAYPFYQRARRADGPLTGMEALAFERRADQVARVCRQPGRILDLGMGDGVFLELMRRKGWETIGVDREPDVVAFARERLGLEACMTADIELDPLPAGPFDVVTMWGLLQLIYRPQQLLEKIRPVLSPLGVIAIGVSNIGGAGAHLFGSHWRGLGLPRHLVHFDPQSIRRLVDNSGYRTLCMAFETPYWIVAPSVDASLPLPGLFGGIARRFAHLALSPVSRTRLGDTMIVLARLADGQK